MCCIPTVVPELDIEYLSSSTLIRCIPLADCTCAVRHHLPTTFGIQFVTFWHLLRQLFRLR
jgi:hypothetical protein